MKRLIPMLLTWAGVLVLAVVLGVVASGCSGGSDWQPPRDLSLTEQKLVQSSNRFGFGFFQEIVSQSDGGNLFVSPLSVSMALGMTWNGARGDTEAGMRECLEFGELGADEINQGYRDLIDLLTGLDPKVQMEIANSIWYRQGFEVLAAFLDTAVSYFDAVVEVLDFGDPNSADVINAWVAEKTHDRIPSIVEKPLSDAAVMFLINAIYFKGTWVTQFDTKDTHDAAFHAPAGDTSVKMMTIAEAKLPSMVREDFSAASLPYGQGLFQMTILLPAEGKDIDELISEMNQENWDNWLAQMAETEMDLYLPRFELAYEELLNDTLIELGMGDAFSDQADFSGINPAGGLLISKVKHKSFVKVNEEGTEAAAVTSVQVDLTSAPDEFRVDRPFIFVIHDRHSGALLFMGKIVDPSA